MKKIVIVGGGIVGFSAAVNIIENETNVTVTLIAEKISPDTTGDVAAGLMTPYLIGDVSPEKLNYWFEESKKYFLKLLNSEIASKVGVSLISGVGLQSESEKEPPFTDNYLHFHKLTKEELRNYSSKYDKGYFYTTLVIECCKLLPYFRKRFEEKGGQIRLEKVNKIENLFEEFDVIVNCTGLGAREFAAETDLIPVRGQVMRVNAPWIKHVTFADSYYIIPQSDCVVLGGTAQSNDWNLNVSQEDSRNIRRGCEEVVPSLRNAVLVSENVGLRPSRAKGPRVERETKMIGNKTYYIIHNYGHGGCGVTLSWGCAQHVRNLLQECLQQTAEI